MPGRHVTDRHMELFMKFRQTDPTPIAAAKAGFSTATGYRIAADPQLRSAKRQARSRRRPDLLEAIFDTEIVPMLEAAPHLRPIAIFEEVIRRHPDLKPGIRRTIERRVREWRALHGPQPGGDLPPDHEPGRLGLSDFTDMDDIAVTIAHAAPRRASCQSNCFSSRSASRSPALISACARSTTLRLSGVRSACSSASRNFFAM